MNDNIIDFPGETLLDLPVEVVLEGAKAKDLEHVLVIARKTNGDYYFASTTADAHYMNWLADKFKQGLLEHE